MQIAVTAVPETSPEMKEQLERHWSEGSQKGVNW